jgi:hypothetical protein
VQDDTDTIMERFEVEDPVHSGREELNIFEDEPAF